MPAHRSHFARIAPLVAAVALGALGTLMVWIATGGRPFGHVVGAAQVSGTTPAPDDPTPARPVSVRRHGAKPGYPAAAARLRSKPPAAVRARTGRRPTLRARTVSARRIAARRNRARARRTAPVRSGGGTIVNAPLNTSYPGTPVAAVPTPRVPAPPPAPAGGPAPREAPAVKALPTGGAGEG
jgi:hypothetical protein